MQANRWEHFSHDADIGVRGIGASQEQAFEQVALAMTAVITDLAWVEAQEMVEIVCEAPDPELLLVDWLNALVFEMATRHLLFSRFEVRVYGQRLQGRAWGEKVNVAKHYYTGCCAISWHFLRWSAMLSSRCWSEL
jgi:SHS2 domain-containing protein